MPIEPHQQRRVLIIDDEDIIRDSMSPPTWKTAVSFVCQARDGREGLDRFPEATPDVVLLDLRMPRMDGLEVLEAIARPAGPGSP